jgi:hypothetical protein
MRQGEINKALLLIHRPRQPGKSALNSAALWGIRNSKATKSATSQRSGSRSAFTRHLPGQQIAKM